MLTVVHNINVNLYNLKYDNVLVNVEININMI